MTAYSPLGSGDRPQALKDENNLSLIANFTINTIFKKHNTTTQLKF